MIFGHIETSWFEVMNGVKQGCILSPTLFSTATVDLVRMLEQENVGIYFQNTHIPALLYADDIVLMANSEVELQKMLEITDNFAKNGVSNSIAQNRR